MPTDCAALKALLVRAKRAAAEASPAKITPVIADLNKFISRSPAPASALRAIAFRAAMLLAVAPVRDVSAELDDCEAARKAHCGS